MDINIGVVSLGCPKNLVDTELILGNLSRCGFKITPNAENADVIIINTCGFIDKAKQESINTILEMAEYRTKGRCRALIVIGCLVERYSQDIIKDIPEVDAVVSIKQYSELIGIIRDILKLDKDSNKTLFLDDYIHRMRSTPLFMAYLKISDGCDNKCSYCVIPSIRGAYKSREIESIIAEAKYLANYGVKEIIIIAQDTTKYGIDIYGKPKLVQLLKRLCEIQGIEWIRLMYTYPESITDELIEIIANEKKICKYIDLPIQHISDSILKAMKRKGSSLKIREVIRKLRDKIPDIAIRTSVIVGFPGETEEDFNKLIDFIEETKFDRLGVFTYSREQGTPAAKLPNQLPYKIKKIRESKVMKLQKQISRAINQKFIGNNIRTLIEGKIKPNSYFGRTYRDGPEIDGIVYIKSKRELKAGTIEDVKITGAALYDLTGGVE